MVSSFVVWGGGEGAACVAFKVVAGKFDLKRGCDDDDDAAADDDDDTDDECFSGRGVVMMITIMTTMTTQSTTTARPGMHTPAKDPFRDLDLT